MTNSLTHIQGSQVTVSIISHGHCSMLNNLLMQINDLESSVSHVIITHNIPSDLILDEGSFSFQITVIRNKLALGFGTNHNNAFKKCATEYFCILNPDVEFVKDPFYELLDCLKDNNIGIAAPIVLNSSGEVEDSHRKFPTPVLILKKFFFDEKGLYKLDSDSRISYPDWVAGMFMLVRSSTYKLLDGFDEKYFLYYEDIDLCLRSWREKKSVAVSKNVSIMHNAQRDSHSNLKFLSFHLKSMFRFFFKHWLRLPR